MSFTASPKKTTGEANSSLDSAALKNRVGNVLNGPTRETPRLTDPANLRANQSAAPTRPVRPDPAISRSELEALIARTHDYMNKQGVALETFDRPMSNDDLALAVSERTAASRIQRKMGGIGREVSVAQLDELGIEFGAPGTRHEGVVSVKLCENLTMYGDEARAKTRISFARTHNAPATGPLFVLFGQLPFRERTENS